MDRDSKVFYIAGGDIGWDNRIIGEKKLVELVLDLPERMWTLACLYACGHWEVAEKVIVGWQDMDEKLAELGQ